MVVVMVVVVVVVVVVVRLFFVVVVLSIVVAVVVVVAFNCLFVLLLLLSLLLLLGGRSVSRCQCKKRAAVNTVVDLIKRTGALAEPGNCFVIVVVGSPKRDCSPSESKKRFLIDSESRLLYKEVHAAIALGFSQIVLSSYVICSSINTALTLSCLRIESEVERCVSSTRADWLIAPVIQAVTSR